MYYMQLNGMYVMTVTLTSKEHISMDSEVSYTTNHTVRIQHIESVSGKHEALKFEETDTMDAAVMKELEALGYVKEKADVSYEFSDITSPVDNEKRFV